MRLTLVNLCQKVGELTIKQSNLPERYIKKSLERVYFKTPNLYNYQRKVVKKKKFHFDVHRPWTREFQELNEDGKMHRKVFLEPIKEWSVFKGDRVEILVGKDKGKQGIVADVIQERNAVIVEGMNTYLRLMGKNKNFPGVLMQQEYPLLVTSEISLVDPSDLQPVKIEWRYTEDGQKVRVSERSGRIIPIPKNAEETYDFKAPGLYVDKDMDTSAEEVSKVTFEPLLETFEMSVMREMGIKEERVEAETYWY